MHSVTLIAQPRSKTPFAKVGAMKAGKYEPKNSGTFGVMWFTDFGDKFAKHDIKKYIQPTSETLAEATLYAIEGLTKSKKDNLDNSFLKKILSFTKIEHTIFSLPLIFAGVVLGSKAFIFSNILLICLATVGARIFGMSLNRIFDRFIDQKNPRTSMNVNDITKRPRDALSSFRT